MPQIYKTKGDIMENEFKKYQHVTNMGTLATENILCGSVYVFPKLDALMVRQQLPDLFTKGE